MFRDYYHRLLGGKTVVENARLVHASCHPRGPVRVKADQE